MIELKKAATKLKISLATLNNWIKKLQVSSIDGSLSKEDFKFIKKELSLKLNNRANKSNSKLTFIPKEYFKDNSFEIHKAELVIQFLDSLKLNLEEKVYLFTLFVFVKKGMLKSISLGLDLEPKSFRNKNLYQELKSWNLDTSKIKKSSHKSILELELPESDDLLGAIYQSLLSEGDKAKLGSYYTPANQVEKIVDQYCKKDFKVLDPCCGTGSFLISMSKVIKNPENIYGYDSDSLAIKLARLNLILAYPRLDNYRINIKVNDSLLAIENSEKFDFICSNPPWGYMFNPETLFQLGIKFPEIRSGESFSYFLMASMKLLKPKGILSFILPESILKVKTHKDIRNYLILNSSIKEIHFLGAIFRKVMSNVVRIDLTNEYSAKNKLKVFNLKKKFVANQIDFLKNESSQISIQKSPQDDSIINKIYSNAHTTLKNQAEWGLGIVTGNNSLFLKNEKTNDDYSIILTGKNINPFILKPPFKYIKFDKDQYQQCVPEEKFLVKEKIVYRFISKRIVAVLDSNQNYTLNSANFIVPQVEGYSNKVIVALFNSNLYNFIFQKKFNSIKILRADLEQLPLPNFDKKDTDTLVNYYEQIIEGKSSIKELNKFLYNFFKLTAEEVKYLEKELL